jgi:error-prone DNA polymerase
LSASAKITAGLLARDYTLDFAQSICRQLKGFGEYGFPESHAASFALLAYASAYLKCHEPEAFLAALLNSQPMGFYAPNQLVQDARRHGVQVLPVDVMFSSRHATLEVLPVKDSLVKSPVSRQPGSEWPAKRQITATRPAVRLGLNQIKSLSDSATQRIEQARCAHPFIDVSDMARRAMLNRQKLDALAAVDALLSLAGHRRQALWMSAISVAAYDILHDAPIRETQLPALSALSDEQTVIADYRSLRLSLAHHPVALLRTELTARRFEPYAVLATYPDKRLARACGLVTMRQRP